MKRTYQNKEYADLKKAILAKKLKSLYILHGEEDYLREYYLTEMKKTVLGEGAPDFNLKKLNGRTFDLSEFNDAVNSLPSFSEMTFVEVRDYDMYTADEKTAQQLITILSDIPEYCCIAFIFDLIEFRPDRRKRIHSVIEAKAKVVEIPVQEHSDLTNWIKRRFKHNGKAISREDAEYLMFYCSDLMTGLISEIEKISAYARSDTISRADIEAVAVPVPDAAAFNMVNAISQNDFGKAVKILSQLFQMRESPTKLLAILGAQIRRLYFARLAYEQNKDKNDIKAMLELRSDYQARLLMEAAPSFSLKWCEDAVTACAETDLKMKSTSIGENICLTDLLIFLAGQRSV
ncbi:MAG: DNA polymerase III subunit delta [Clostridiales bacterium]|nr:DNA polymerase III subunit delta [Clostridiales bacterium]